MPKPYSVVVLEAVARLLEAADRDTGQGRCAADFLLAWHDAGENGGWSPTDLWKVDERRAGDMLTVLRFLAWENIYADELGFEPEMRALWQKRRGGRGSAPSGPPQSGPR